MSADLSMANFVKESAEFFDNFSDENKKICFILSDGRMNKNMVRPLLVDAERKGIIYIFVILDIDEMEESILNY